MLAAGMSAQETIDASSAFARLGTPVMERQLSWLLGRNLEDTRPRRSAGAAGPARR
jgi:hypothetical protein